MPQGETEKAMPFQIKQNIPLPLSEIAVDWVRVGQRDDASGFVKQQILIIAIPNETIARFKTIFKIAGLSLRALEVETLSCARALVGTDQTPTIVLDIGARSSNISVIEKGFLKSNTQIDYGGDAVTDAIANGLSVSYKRAEELKRRIGMLGGSGELELSTLEMPFIDVILNEVQSVRQKAMATLGVAPERVMLVGGGANLAGIVAYAEKRLGMAVVLGNGLLYIDVPQELGAMVPELKTRFSVAAGLAIKSLLA
jgi:type IV pilus assembly protein PilM